ncbi:MAG: thioredoxin domain-containing protein [Salegentibacter sp.]
MEDQHSKYTNSLIHETSPYLLQHAHNPVDWQAWNKESLDQARRENKLIIISIGYSACHWCHVMEHESFEDEQVAEVMNDNFISIKVDREERPDVDQVYMNAVQVMTGSGGWPMNVVALPDGRAVWGGTYFKKQQWIEALGQLSGLYKKKPGEMEEYAARLAEGLQQIELIELPEKEEAFTSEFIDEVMKKWENRLDFKNGGSRGAPKFMMPNNLDFLLRLAFQKKDRKLRDYVQTSLEKISYGGVYDHVGGGFSRYSVDDHWHIPHFEKMLYDNAQLVSLYSKAYSHSRNSWFKEVVQESLNFIEQEFTDESGAFYSAWDADSKNEQDKNEEGAYFAWTKEELQKLIKEDFELFADYYNINAYGKWEGEKYVLIRSKSDAEIAKAAGISEEILKEKKQHWLEILQKEREKRPKPALDNKILTSWNAMMLTGLVDAYKALQKEEYLQRALKNARFLKKYQLQQNYRLYHSHKNGKSTINAYLEDYAFCIEAFLGLYEVTLNEDWLELAKELTEVCYSDFHNEKNDLFYFTSAADAPLVTRPMETTDNVIPASNSVMAKNLFKLGRYYSTEKYSSTAANMLRNIKPQIMAYPSGYSNWLDLMLNFTEDFFEVVVTGENVSETLKKLNRQYLPYSLKAGAKKESALPLTLERFKPGKELIYVCREGKCELPVTSLGKALDLLNHV